MLFTSKVFVGVAPRAQGKQINTTSPGLSVQAAFPNLGQINPLKMYCITQVWGVVDGYA
jgi:hypothetical protein